MIDLEDSTASLDLAFSVAGEFGIKQSEGKRIAKEVARSTSKWRKVAGSLGIKTSEVERMASAFEHDDLSAALNLIA